MTPEKLLIFYVGAVFLGYFIEIGFSKLHFIVTKKHYKTHHFSLGKYLYFIFIPTFGAWVVYNAYGHSILYAFGLFAIVGTLIEFLLGMFYDKIIGQRLWTYHRYAIGGYTSLLSIPLWGFAGVVFWLLARALV